jgi:hypothetical protein
VRTRPESHRQGKACEIGLGDEEFDSAFYVAGPKRLVSALLDADARRLLLLVNAEGRVEIAGGEIRRAEGKGEKKIGVLLAKPRRSPPT